MTLFLPSANLLPSIRNSLDLDGAGHLDVRKALRRRGTACRPWFRVHPAERRVGRPVPTKSGALPLRGDRVATGGKLHAGVDGLVTRHSSLPFSIRLGN